MNVENGARAKSILIANHGADRQMSLIANHGADRKMSWTNKFDKETSQADGKELKDSARLTSTICC